MHQPLNRRQKQTDKIQEKTEPQTEFSRIPTPFSVLAYHGITAESIHTFYTSTILAMEEVDVETVGSLEV